MTKRSKCPHCGVVNCSTMKQALGDSPDGGKDRLRAVIFDNLPMRRPPPFETAHDVVAELLEEGLVVDDNGIIRRPEVPKV